MDNKEKTNEQLFEELAMLRKQVSELEGRRAASREDRLKLAILDRAPLSIWACNKKFEIVLWTVGSTKIYKYEKENAIGKNYLQLFVDPPERYQSLIDCCRIVDDDYVQTNCLAYDVNQDGEHRTMLTNCFRIWDEDNEEYLQAEVALDISDLELRRNEFFNLREAGNARVESQRRTIIDRLQHIFAEKLNTYKQQKQELDKWVKGLRGSNVAAESGQTEGGLRKALDESKKKCQEKYHKLSVGLKNACSLEELDDIETEVEEYASEDFNEINE